MECRSQACASSSPPNGRSLRAERLEAAEVEEVQENLLDIARINRWFGGHRTLLQLLRGLVGPLDRFSIVDVGAASGDMGRCIQNRFPRATVVSLDRQALHLKTANTPRIAADAFALPFRERSFDLVMSSSFLHHFSNVEVSALLREMRRVARTAVIILDIERHAFASFFLRATRGLFGWSELTVHDGCLSVDAAFQLPELQSIVSVLTPGYLITRRHLPWFRVSAVFTAEQP